MQNLKHIEQGSIEWLQLKWGLVGGTLSKGLLVKSDTLLIDILSQKIEEFEPSESYKSDSMNNGNEMEPFARQYLEQYTGLKFETTGLWISDELPLLCLSPDGFTDDEEIACEIKCLQRKAHTEILFNNETPLEYLPQIVHYFTVNPKLKKLYFIAYRPESIKPFICEYTLDSEVDLKQKKTIEVKNYGVGGKELKPSTKQVPDIKTIREWTEISKAAARNMQQDLKTAIASLDF